jgi:hypothetical protein
MVEHPRLVDELLREPQRAPRVAGEQHALGNRLVRLEDERRGVHARPFKLRSHNMAKKDKKKDKSKDDSARTGAVDAVEALRAVVERTFAEGAPVHARACGGHRHGGRAGRRERPRPAGGPPGGR